MTTISITLPESFSIVSRNLGVDINPSTLSADIIGKLVLHGLTQKVADAAAGAKKVAGEGADDAKVAETGQALMQKVVDSLVAGNWGVERGTGTARVSDFTKAMRAVLRPIVSGKLGKAAWKTMEEEERTAAIDTAWTNVDAKGEENATRIELMRRIDKQLEVMAAERAAKADAAAVDLGDIEL